MGGGVGGAAEGSVAVMRDVGATFFNLNSLHEDLRDVEVPSVIEVDFYHAASLLPLRYRKRIEKTQALATGWESQAGMEGRL